MKTRTVDSGRERRLLRIPFLALILILASVPIYGLDLQSFHTRNTFESINRIRVREGLSKLAFDDNAARSARRHAEELAGRMSLSHVGLDGSRVADRYRSAGGSGLSAGENLGAGDSVERIIAAWMDSPGHKDNLLNPKWRKLGIGIHVLESGRLIVVAVFTDSRFEILNKDSDERSDSPSGEAVISGRFLLSSGTFPSRIELSCSSGDFSPYSAHQQDGLLLMEFRFPVPGEWIEGLPATFRLFCTENEETSMTDLVILYP